MSGVAHYSVTHSAMPIYLCRYEKTRGVAMKLFIFALFMGIVCVLGGSLLNPTPFLQFVLIGCGSTIILTASFGCYVESKRG
jgi:hypothetical protein